MSIRKSIALSIIICLLPILVFADEGKGILEKVDALASYTDSDFAAQYTIVEEKKNGDRQKTVSLVFRRDAQSMYTIVIKEPEISQGQGYLKVENSLWFYDPDSRRFNFSSAKDRFQNTNARNSDFTKSTLAEDYKVVAIEDEALGRYQCRKLTLEAVTDEVAYPKMIIWVDENYLLRKSEDYSLSGRLLRVSAFPSYTQIDGRYVPSRFLLQEVLSKEKTQISISRVSFNDIPNSTFSKQFLENVSR
ncbi:MAG: outer membrane lipoprotein-sorting protein [Spirochaetales bacterium]|nr:outer membrane lipoprotein-sorting protein [Spirochaetales bacterium]